MEKGNDPFLNSEGKREILKVIIEYYNYKFYNLF